MITKEIIDLEAEMEERAEEKELQITVKNLQLKMLDGAEMEEPANGNKLKINVQGNNQHESNESQSPKIDPEETEHMTMFKKIINFFDLIGLSFGIKFSFDFKPHTKVMEWYTHFLLAFFWFSVIRGAYIHCSNGDYVRILELFALCGMGSSCNLKWNGCLTKYKSIASLIYSAGKLCRENLVGSRAEVIKSGLSQAITVLKVYGMGVIACLTFFMVLPIKSFFLDGIWVSLLPMDIIFCDQSTLKGFIAANIVHASIGVQYALATIMYTSAFIVSISYYKFQVDLVEEDFKDLDKMWNGRSTTSVAYRHAYLYNICKKLQDMHRFFDTVQSIYTTKLCIYFFISYLAQIVCLFEVTKNSWLPGLPAAISLFIEMLFYCLIGTHITIAGDKLCEIIYNTNWYNYDLTSQRVLLVMLHDSQMSQEIILGPIGPLNVVTFVTVVKSIYSYYTVLTELL